MPATEAQNRKRFGQTKTPMTLGVVLRKATAFKPETIKAHAYFGFRVNNGVLERIQFNTYTKDADGIANIGRNFNPVFTPVVAVGEDRTAAAKTLRRSLKGYTVVEDNADGLFIRAEGEALTSVQTQMAELEKLAETPATPVVAATTAPVVTEGAANTPAVEGGQPTKATGSGKGGKAK